MSLDNIPPTSRPLWDLGLDYRPPSSEDADSVSPPSSEVISESFHTATIELPGIQFPLGTSAGPSTHPIITVPISHLRRPSAHTESGAHLLRRSNSIPHLAAPGDMVTNTPPHIIPTSSQLAEISATRRKPSNPSESSRVRRHVSPQRLSVLRQGGTASVLDLASLVRAARDRAQESMEFIGSPPAYNYYTTTSSFDQPPSRPSLKKDLTDEQPPHNNVRNASIKTKSPHQTPVRRRLISRLDGVPEFRLPPEGGTSHQTGRSVAPSLASSSCAQPHKVDNNKRSVVKGTRGRRQMEPRLSSSPPNHHEYGSTRQPSSTSDLGRHHHHMMEEAQVPSYCLPISMETRRPLGRPKERRLRRSKSYSDSMADLREYHSHEKEVPEAYQVVEDEEEEAGTSMSSDTPPPEVPVRLRSLSGSASTAALINPLQILSSSMRKKSGFFRRKASASQSQAVNPTWEEASAPPQLPCSSPLSESRTLRQPFNSEPSVRHHHYNHHQLDTPSVDTPPVPIVPLSYHQNSSAQSNNPPPSSMPPPPLKTRLPSPSSSSTRPGHSLDPQDPSQTVSIPTHPRFTLIPHQNLSRSSLSQQSTSHGSTAESLLSPTPPSRSHSPALSHSKHFPMPSSSPTSSQPTKSSWLHSTSSSRAFGDRPDHSLILRGTQTRPPSSINLPLSSLSKGRNTYTSLEHRPSKTRPMLSAATFLGSCSSTPVEADDSQLTSQPPLSSSLAPKPNSPTHRTTTHLSSQGLSEEEQLRLSLERWDLDQDGILRGCLASADSPTTPKASLDIDALSSSGSVSSFFSASSDLNDLNLHSQDAAIPERVLYKHIVRSPPAVNQYNLTKNPTETSTFSTSHCLPSLVNPNRTTMQSRYPAEPFDRPLNTLSRIKVLDLPDDTVHLPSPSQLVTSPSHLSSQHSSSSGHSTAKLTSGSPASPNPSTVGPSSPQPTVVSRANSMKECRDPSSAEQVTTALVNKFRRRGYTEDVGALAPKLLGSHFPAPPRLPSIPISAQPDDTSRATSPESASITLDSLLGTEAEDGGTDDLPSRLTPSIRFVSSTSHTNSGEQDSLTSPVTVGTPLKSCTGSTRSSPLNRGDLSQSSRSSGNTSATASAHHYSQVPKSAHPFRCNPGLGVKPTVESDRSLAPQLHRRDLDHIPQPKYGAVMEDHRTPRNHQSSPNLRKLRLSTPPDNSFFSVIVSGPQLPTDGSVVPERQPLVADPSQLHPLSSPGSSPNHEGSSSDPPDSRNSLIIPGMTLEVNALRLAELLWQGDESIIKRRKLTEWLGSPDTPENQLQGLTRRAFMNNFDFKDLRIDLAFRKLCTKMYLKGETQQVDRILAEFSRRYWEQNQSHIYVNADMVHALSYSILLLNTDLHVVDTTSRMSRSQFIRNTLETVYAQLSHSAPSLITDASKISLPVSSRPSLTTDPLKPNFKNASSGSMVTRNRRTSIVDLNRPHTSSHSPTRSSMERWRGALSNGSQPVMKASRRSHSITSWPSDSDLQARASVSSFAPPTSVTERVDRHHSVDARTSRSSVMGRPDDNWNTAPFTPNDSGLPASKSDRLSKALFDKEIETLLKDIYVAIKNHPIAQNPAQSHSQEPAPYGSLQRIGSRRNHLSGGVGDATGPHKRASLRGFGGFAAMLSASTETAGARPSSPTPSVTTSVSSLPSGMMGYSSNAGSSVNLTNLTTPSIGFVSNLSQSIIREQREEESVESTHIEDEMIRDSELALLGAPWAKEGILQRKQYWESKGKRHRDRSWAEVFVVIQTGVLKMFQFGQAGSSAASGAGMAPSPGNEHDNATNNSHNNHNASSNSTSAVGGGNWLPNAQLLGAITLSHALTSVLVSGYSKERPHVFVLTLSSGASYFFQAGTEELVYEWVSTCNYWAARLSKEPLTGGVSNMEYGWNQLQEMDLVNAADKKEELRKCQTDREEMMSIVSGQSGHSHKGRRLRDRLFNGLPLGAPHSPSLPSHPPSHRTSDLERWSQSATSIDSQAAPAAQLITDPKSPSTTITANPALLPLDRHLPPSHPPPSLPDKLTISDWNPPVPPMALSSLPEHVQLATLKRHNAHMQVELEKHNLLRRPMVNLYWNRPIHLQKAMANWEKKSQYLMAEIIKYTTYLNALEATMHLKVALAKQRAGARVPASSESH